MIKQKLKNNSKLGNSTKLEICYLNYLNLLLHQKIQKLKNLSCPVFVLNLQIPKNYQQKNTKNTKKLSANKIFDDLLVCKKLSVDGTLFSSHHIITKRSDSCFYTATNKIGQIEYFVLLDSKILVIYRQIVCLFNPFYSLICPEIRSKISACYHSNQFLVEELTSLNKGVLINLSESECYISHRSVCLICSINL